MYPNFFKNQQYFTALMEASIVSKTDINGIIIDANESFCKMSGYTREEIIGRTHSIFRHPENPTSLYTELWDTIKSGKIWRGRMINLNKDGSNFIAETTIIPLIEENGRILEYLALRNDITNMVKLKREIFFKEQEKIEQEKIHEAQKSFLLLFAHELRTPLNAIINFAIYIKKQLQKPKEYDQEKILGLLDSISLNGSDMLEMINMILETSKLNTHKLTYTHSLFNPNDIISEALIKYDSLIKEKNINLIFHSDQKAFIYSDKYRFQQIFSNIFSNAIKYGHDEIIITVSGEDDFTYVAVEDNGGGIKDKEAVFNLYAQEDDNFLQRKGSGIGIGLYFVKLLCQDLLINYKIEDRANKKGTKFILRFNNKTTNPLL
jgi:PAS domain S-box-containing protein